MNSNGIGIINNAKVTNITKQNKMLQVCKFAEIFSSYYQKRNYIEI